MWTSIGVRENIKVSALESIGNYELKQYKPLFDKECSKLLNQWSRLNCSNRRI
jgi:hypothetical protein